MPAENFKLEGPEGTPTVSWEANPNNARNADSYEVNATLADGENITLSVTEPRVRFSQLLQRDSLVSVSAVVTGSMIYKSPPNKALYITRDGETLTSLPRRPDIFDEVTHEHRY